LAHHYKARDGRILPSVTTVIGDMLKYDYSYWYASLKRKGIDPETELNRLADIGTICHYRVLSRISPTEIEAPGIPVKKYPKDARKYADLFDMMWDDLKIKVERPVCEKFNADEMLGFCGTFDMFGEVYGVIGDKRPEGRGRKIELNGHKCLIDLKTSKEASEKHFIQLGGYSLFAPEVPDYGIVVCLCPYIEKNRYIIPKCYVLDRVELLRYKQKFKNLLYDWWLINGNEQKRAERKEAAKAPIVKKKTRRNIKK